MKSRKKLRQIRHGLIDVLDALANLEAKVDASRKDQQIGSVLQILSPMMGKALASWSDSKTGAAKLPGDAPTPPTGRPCHPGPPPWFPSLADQGEMIAAAQNLAAPQGKGPPPFFGPEAPTNPDKPRSPGHDAEAHFTASDRALSACLKVINRIIRESVNPVQPDLINARELILRAMVLRPAHLDGKK